LGQYDTPRIIPTSPHFKGDPQLQWTVIVRDSFGAAGVKDSWTPEQLRRGKIPLRIGRFFDDEILLLDKDCTLAQLPARLGNVVY